MIFENVSDRSIWNGDVMELYQLKTFVAVAEEGNLTRAAERLHTSQPSVSAHVKALEDELGLPLFERTPKGMQLTPAGSALKTRAEDVLKAANAVRFEATRLKGELTGEVHLGLHIDPHYLRITELLTVMRNTHPGVELHYLQRMTWEAPEELRAGKLDVAFVNRKPESDEFIAHTLETLDLVIVGPMAWKDRLKNADWQTITSFPWVWTHSLCPIYGIADTLFTRRGRSPIKAVIADQEPAIRKLVNSGVGLSILIAKEAHDAATGGKLFIVKDNVGTIDLSLIYLRKRAEDPLIKAVLQAVQKVWGDFNDRLAASVHDVEGKRSA